MSDWEAPERVWIGPGIHWQEPPEGTEYVRADRLAAVERERDDLARSLHDEALDAAYGEAHLRARVEELEAGLREIIVAWIEQDGSDADEARLMDAINVGRALLSGSREEPRHDTTPFGHGDCDECGEEGGPIAFAWDNDFAVCGQCAGKHGGADWLIAHDGEPRPDTGETCPECRGDGSRAAPFDAHCPCAPFHGRRRDTTKEDHDAR